MPASKSIPEALSGRTDISAPPGDMNVEIDASLIVCTRNRAGQLKPCLQAIAELEYTGTWEIIIVDNGSTDATQGVIRAVAPDMPAPLVSIVETRPGLSAARNAGLAVARGRIIIFTDDDCYVAPDYVAQATAAFADERIGFVTGRVELHDPSDARVTINTSREPRRFRARQYIHVDRIIGANFAFRRSIIARIGVFDELIGAGTQIGGGEDTDYAARIVHAGWEGLYCPDMVISHHHGRKEADIPKMLRAYAEGQGAYTLKYLLRGDVPGFLKGIVSVRWQIGPPNRWNRDTLSLLYRLAKGTWSYGFARLFSRPAHSS
ncbi:MAG: glycosyltransferase [Hyphomonas sp.]